MPPLLLGWTHHGAEAELSCLTAVVHDTGITWGGERCQEVDWWVRFLHQASQTLLKMIRNPKNEEICARQHTAHG